jgi:hypothetical protein
VLARALKTIAGRVEAALIEVVYNFGWRKATFFLALLLLTAPEAARGQFTNANADGGVYTYSTNGHGSITVTGYTGPPWAITIPTKINGLTVTSIGDFAFDIGLYGPYPPH